MGEPKRKWAAAVDGGQKMAKKWVKIGGSTKEREREGRDTLEVLVGQDQDQNLSVG